MLKGVRREEGSARNMFVFSGRNRGPRSRSNSHFDVAQASRLRVHGASPPRGASNGETPSELAAETAALRRRNENY
jgi:hypothetical protein